MTEQKPLTGYPSIDKPWLKYYSEEAINAPLPECTMYEYLWENNKDYPDDIAINYLGRKITYRELFENIERTAKAFTALGVKSGDIVTVALPSIPEALYCVYALNRLGAVANMIHPLAGEKEILHYLNEVKSKAAVIFDGTYKIIGKSITQTSVKRAVVVSAGCSLPFGIKQLYGLKNKKEHFRRNTVFMHWEEFIKAGRDKKAAIIKKNSGETAIISHTGGTTGEPKGVMCSDRNINAIIWQIGHILPVVRQERQLAVLPPFVNYSLVNAMLEPLALGNTTILIPDYKSSKFLEYARRYKPAYVSSIPPYWEELLKDDKTKSFDLSCLKYPFYGGEAMDAVTEEAVNQLLLSHGAPNRLAKGLGMTELVSAATLTPYNHNMIGSAGIPLPKINCKIVDPDTLTEVPYRQEGEICFAGPTVMLGYYNKPKETDEIIKVHSDGERWLHTGDLGYISEDGVVYVTGRIKRIMITRGKDGISTKMFPDRIEKVINMHPAVRLCCVVGVPDKQRIHYAKAVIELNDGFAPSDELIADIQNFCRDKLPEYQIPDVIEFIDALPRTERGKVDYRALEKLAAEETHHNT